MVDGEKNPAIIVKEVKNAIREHTSGTIDYVEVVSYPRLTPVFEIVSKSYWQPQYISKTPD